MHICLVEHTPDGMRRVAGDGNPFGPKFPAPIIKKARRLVVRSNNYGEGIDRLEYTLYGPGETLIERKEVEVA